MTISTTSDSKSTVNASPSTSQTSTDVLGGTATDKVVQRRPRHGHAVSVPFDPVSVRSYIDTWYARARSDALSRDRMPSSWSMFRSGTASPLSSPKSDSSNGSTDRAQPAPGVLASNQATPGAASATTPSDTFGLSSNDSAARCCAMPAALLRCCTATRCTAAQSLRTRLVVDQCGLQPSEMQISVAAASSESPLSLRAAAGVALIIS